MDYEDQQIKVYRDILHEQAKIIFNKIKRMVIKDCQSIEADILGDSGLKSLWEEIVVIV